MSRPVHYEVEILYETTYRNACGTVALPATKDERQVTCRKCLKALGYQTSETGSTHHDQPHS